jgi:hypothetical protein
MLTPENLSTVHQISTKLQDMGADILYMIDDLDTRNWHNSTKYLLSDLSTLFTLIRNARNFASNMIEVHSEEE